jgi:hypothetical protein
LMSLSNLVSSLDGFALRYFLASASFLRMAITNNTAAPDRTSISPTSFRNAELDAEPRPTFTPKTTNNSIAPISGMLRLLPVANPNLPLCKRLQIQNASPYISALQALRFLAKLMLKIIGPEIKDLR